MPRRLVRRHPMLFAAGLSLFGFLLGAPRHAWAQG
jgi:hypothetical protein